MSVTSSGFVVTLCASVCPTAYPDGAELSTPENVGMVRATLMSASLAASGVGRKSLQTSLAAFWMYGVSCGSIRRICASA
ncbi:MAG: hypothetical protein IJQ81_11750 [Oscillibacter sp.]|nr:hypothetical protein [Oscillibacter sp.]